MKIQLTKKTAAGLSWILRWPTAKAYTKRGFTLLETFVAIVILMMAVVGPLAIVRQSLNSSQYSQDRITAYYLAQDAVEYIREMRDSIALSAGNNGTNTAHGTTEPNWISTNDGSYSLGNCLSTYGCYIDYSASNPTQIIKACSATCPILNYDSTYYYSYHSGSSATIFTRTIMITPQNNPSSSQQDEAILTVTVSWQSTVAGTGNQVVVNQDLFNWHQ